MTTRPELDLGTHLLRGTAAVLLFGVMAVTFLGLDLGSAAGFPEVDSITAVIGYALFDVPADSMAATGTEPFLVAFEIIDVVLVAALVAAVMLARREEGGQVVEALRSLRGGED